MVIRKLLTDNSALMISFKGNSIVSGTFHLSSIRQTEVSEMSYYICSN